jgi:hypothetical protein
MNRRIQLFILFYTLLSIISRADNITVSDTVSGNWSADTIFVIDDIIVAFGSSLNIEPGVRVLFNYHVSMNIDGSISAIGLSDQHIFFGIQDTTGFSNDTIPKGGWKGIRFDNTRSSDTSVFEYCNFSCGKAVDTDSLIMNGGALSINHFNKV